MFSITRVFLCFGSCTHARFGDSMRIRNSKTTPWCRLDFSNLKITPFITNERAGEYTCWATTTSISYDKVISKSKKDFHGYVLNGKRVQNKTPAVGNTSEEFSPSDYIEQIFVFCPTRRIEVMRSSYCWTYTSHRLKEWVVSNSLEVTCTIALLN